ncbi:hypothetical protein Scep_001970 [Stephania cephalantha]|uniref:Uncharacterized protein n=1 Tax=Stephania cephalantha TaxID=152367 RepID=A0AAP0Q5K0_9MAGN
MQRDKMERQEENREMQDRLARIEALLMQHLIIRPHVPPTLRPPPSAAIKCSGPQRDDIRNGVYIVDTQRSTINKSPLGPQSPSQFVHLDDHQPEHWTDPCRELPDDRQQLLDDDEEFMPQLMPHPRPPPWHE